MNIVPLEPNHVPQVEDVYRRAISQVPSNFYTPEQLTAWREYTPPEGWESSFRGSQAYVALEMSGKVAGFIEASHTGHIHLLYVNPNNQGNGVGRRLLNRVACQAMLDKYPALSVSSALNAVNFYRRRGFMEIHTVKQYFGDMELDSLFMVRPLKIDFIPRIEEMKRIINSDDFAISLAK